MERLIKNRIIIICGHFGTGKTNIAVNLCEYAALRGGKCIIADLDIVNPYFRTADNADYLRSLGVTTLIPEYANTNVDLPTIPSGLPQIFDSDALSIIDVGGDNGAVVLGGFANKFEACGYDMYYVYNQKRPENHDILSAEQSFREIERLSLLRFSGVINNTNLGDETTAEMLDSSIAHAQAFAEHMGVPLVLTTSLFEHKDAAVIRNITKKYF